MSYSRPRKGFWGTEYLEHFDDSGNKTGESRKVAALLGGTKWVHHDAGGNKVGESRDMPSGILGGGPRTVHYDTSGHKIGETHDVTGLLGGTKPRSTGVLRVGVRWRPPKRPPELGVC